MMKKQFSLPVVSILIAVALLIGAQVGNVYSGDNIFDQLNKFKDVLSLAEKFYVDDVDTKKMVETAISAMLQDLDPHSVYIPAKDLPKITEEFSGSFEGIGVEFEIRSDTLRVVTPIPGGPSEALGILAGDKIVKINDSSAVGITQDEVPKKLRGPKGTHVKVTIFRAGEKNLIDFDIVREKIPIYTVDVAMMVGPETGYISVTRFAATTTQEFTDGLARLRAKGMKRLVLDLRNNGGGLLDQAFRLGSELIPAGKKIVYTKGRRPEFNNEFVSQGGGFTDVGLIVLVNAGSASASEIVSGAIQDLDRGLVVGETTFGKGLVQQQYPLPDGSAFRLTTARYYTPAGRLIQRPYGKNIDEYRHAVLDRNEEEGDNLEHEEEKGDSSRPAFATAGGRKVFGGGGITPDYIVKQGRLSESTLKMLGAGVFQEYNSAFMDSRGKELRAKYADDIAGFVSGFTVDDAMFADFKAVVAKKDLKLDPDQVAKDEQYVRTRIKAHVGRSLFGNEGWYSTMRPEDVQLGKALTLFPEAERIAGIR
jgi:carboxyl-terminal processing protease